MTDGDLKRRLKDVAVPAPSADHLRETREAARRALLAAVAAPVKACPRRVRPSLMDWVAGLAAVGAAVLLLLPGNPGTLSTPEAATRSLGAEQTVARELVAFFPGQLNAVIERNGQREVKLTEKAESFDSQPVVLDLDRAGDHVRVLSFSGQRVSVPLSGRQVDVEILVNGTGGVVLLAQDRVVLPGKAAWLEGYRLSARTLRTL